MAELVDALVSNTSDSNIVGVQFPLRVQRKSQSESESEKLERSLSLFFLKTHSHTHTFLIIINLQQKTVLNKHLKINHHCF